MDKMIEIKEKELHALLGCLLGLARELMKFHGQPESVKATFETLIAECDRMRATLSPSEDEQEPEERPHR